MEFYSNDVNHLIDRVLACMQVHGEDRWDKDFVAGVASVCSMVVSKIKFETLRKLGNDLNTMFIEVQTTAGGGTLSYRRGVSTACAYFLEIREGIR